MALLVSKHEKNGNKMLRCPYDPQHEISIEMLGEHIESCGKEHVERLRKRGVVLKSVACKFNPEHVLPRMEINAHETWLCPDRNRAPPPASSFRNLFPHLVVLNTSYDGIREAEAKKETLEAEDDVRQALAAEYRALDLPEPSFLTRDASALSRPSPKKTAPLSVTSSRLLSSTLPGDEDEEEDWGKTSTGVVFNSEGRNGPEFMLRYPDGMSRSERKAWKLEAYKEVEKRYQMHGTVFGSVEPKEGKLE